MKKYIVCAFLFLSFYSTGFAQRPEVLPASNESDKEVRDQLLIQNSFLGTDVTIHEVKFTGTPTEGESGNYGHYEIYKSPDTESFFEEGLVLANCPLSSIFSNDSEEKLNLDDNDLLQQEVKRITGIDYEIHDAAMVEFIFKAPSAMFEPTSSAEFEFVFASNEYPTYVCSKYNDIFAFFIDGPYEYNGTTFSRKTTNELTHDQQNVAVIPGTDIPITINTINNGQAGDKEICEASKGEYTQYTQYYKDNTGSDIDLYGRTVPLKAKIDELEPCEYYKLTLAIADVDDYGFNSAVFLKKYSFTATNPPAEFSNHLPDQYQGIIFEGCNDTLSVNFTFPPISEPFHNYFVSIDEEKSTISADDVQFYVEASENALVQVSDNFLELPNGTTEATVYFHVPDNGEDEEDRKLVLKYNPPRQFTKCGQKQFYLEYTVKDPVPIGLNAAEDLVRCGEETSLTIEANPDAIAPLTYLWSTGDLTEEISVSPVVDTSFYVTVTDQCQTSEIKSFNFTMDNPQAAASDDITICQGTEGIVRAEGGDEYIWSDGVQEVGTTGELKVTPTENTTYYVTISKGCTETDSVNVNVQEAISVDFTVPNDEQEGCTPHEVNFTSNVSEANASYQWYFGDGQGSSVQNPSHSYAESGEYSVSLEATYNVCSSSITKDAYIKAQAVPNIVFTADPEEAKQFEPIINFVVDSLSSTASRFDWDFGDGNTAEGSAVYNYYADTGTFVVTLVGQNELGCADTASKEVRIKPDVTLWIPNSFSPNSIRTKNNVWKPKGMNVRDYQLKIYNRWGTVVFESGDIYFGWDGTDINSGKPCPVGSYIYRITYTDDHNRTQEEVGTLFLVD